MKYVLTILLLLVSCSKLSDSRQEIRDFSCDVQKQEGFELRGSATKPRPAMVYFDFDGWVDWHWGTVYPQVPVLPNDTAEVANEFLRVYQGYDVRVTTSEATYFAFTGAKQRVVFTDNIPFTGMAVTNSMANNQGDIYPVFVHWRATRNISCCYNNVPNIYAAWITAHEIGHTVGLYHQVDSCSQQYAGPNSQGFCPIMGLPQNALSVGWRNGTTDYPVCPTSQNDVAIIDKVIAKKRR